MLEALVLSREAQETGATVAKVTVPLMPASEAHSQENESDFVDRPNDELAGT